MGKTQSTANKESNTNQRLTSTERKILQTKRQNKKIQRVNQRIQNNTEFLLKYKPKALRISDHLLENIENSNDLLGIYVPPREFLEIFKYSEWKDVQFLHDDKIYIGQWNCGSASGLGQIFENDEIYYIGFVHNGKPVGHGRMVYRDGSIYEGQWFAGQPFNSGIFYSHSGDVQYKLKEQQIDDIIQSQNPTLIDNSGSVYYGDAIKGKKHGKGIQIWSDGTYYIGEYQNDTRNGLGKMIYNNGNSYFGQFQDNLFHGLGYYKWANGTYYFGKYIKNLKFGFGIYQCEEDRRLEGFFKNGQCNGRILLVNTNTEQKVLQFYEDNKILTEKECLDKGIILSDQKID